jgi:CRISPR/Cas system-associated exonuclease Cas4 (RecB family)
MSKNSFLFISKGKFIHGIQCLKLLWYEYNNKKAIPSPTVFQQEIMKQGLYVGEIARELFPDGIKVDWSRNPLEVEKASLNAIKKKKPVFEAGFTYKRGYAIADILEPSKGGKWNIIEVKSTTDVKEDHLYDVAFQKYVYEGKGLKIDKCFVMHLDREYHRGKELDLEKLFIKTDVTERIEEYGENIDIFLNKMAQTLDNDEPAISVGKQCKACALEPLCWAFLPNDHVFMLRNRKDASWTLMEKGILSMKDIPDDFELNDKHAIQVASHKNGEAHVEKEALNEFLDRIEYPLYFLDFETVATAVPLFINCRPYEDVPFQFSLHVMEGPASPAKHYRFLWKENTDPRKSLLEELERLLKDKGTIMAYNANFEIKCVKNCADAFTEYGYWFEKIKPRFLDLLEPFKKLNYYSPLQEGSASMKYVLPALTGISYKDMEIAEGGMARIEYMRAAYGKDTTEEEKQRIYGALEKYCELDTKGMIDILEVLKREAA